MVTKRIFFADTLEQKINGDELKAQVDCLKSMNI
jgi:hypothetical protein